MSVTAPLMIVPLIIVPRYNDAPCGSLCHHASHHCASIRRSMWPSRCIIQKGSLELTQKTMCDGVQVSHCCHHYTTYTAHCCQHTLPPPHPVATHCFAPQLQLHHCVITFTSICFSTLLSLVSGPVRVSISN